MSYTTAEFILITNTIAVDQEELNQLTELQIRGRDQQLHQLQNLQHARHAKQMDRLQQKQQMQEQIDCDRVAQELQPESILTALIFRFQLLKNSLTFELR